MGLLDRFLGDESVPEGMTVKELIADGMRGRPDVDLRDYAAARGLSHRDHSTQLPYLAAFPCSEELQFNVLRGTLPGGEDGVLFHEVKVFDESTGGTFFGKKATTPGGVKEALSKDRVLEGGALPLFKVPHTTVAIRIPEAQGVLVGFQLARRHQGLGADSDVKVGFSIGGSARKTGPPQWAAEDLKARGHKGWRATYRGRGDEAVQQRLIDGPVEQLLSSEQPERFRATFRFGVLVLDQQHFLKQEDNLDELAQKASWLAGEVRRACEPALEPLALDTELPEPAWAEPWRAAPSESFSGGDGQDFGSAAAVAAERGLALEDAFAFARGFCDMGFPGEPYAVMRGTLPGTGVSGRVVNLLGRPARASGLDGYLDAPVGGPFGFDAVLLPARPDAEETAPGGEKLGERGRYVVRRGIFAAWAPRAGNRVDGDEVDGLVADAAAAAA
jgi:hypothetical protein